MSRIKPLNYITPHKRDKPLFKNAADVLEKAVELSYYPQIEKLKNLYNPTSPYYDPTYVLNLLGASTLQSLLSDITDTTSLSMIISNIYNIKGTKKAFEAILKLLKLDYETIIYTQQANGCTDATIIFSQGTPINVIDIINLDAFSREVFPLCLTLAGITNCILYEETQAYTGYNTINLGVHLLDRDFVCDLSRLDTSYGVIDTSISNTISLLLCNYYPADLNAYSNLTLDSLETGSSNATLTYYRSPANLLDINLILDRQNPSDFYQFLTDLGHLTSSDLICGNYFTTDTKLQRRNYNSFILDWSILDTEEFAPLEGIRGYYAANGLDFGTYLDNIVLGYPTTILVPPPIAVPTNDYTFSTLPQPSIVLNATKTTDDTSTLNLSNIVVFNNVLTDDSTSSLMVYSSILLSTGSDYSTNNILELDFSEYYDSQYLPGIN